ncbi:OPT oligopeptide transporter protein-domain-containing protein [Cladochytrium replicatum]|nr:OPT oligopeptide transporter protein-domain-containing protein [Cladochytrium replicatum]
MMRKSRESDEFQKYIRFEDGSRLSDELQPVHLSIDGRPTLNRDSESQKPFTSPQYDTPMVEENAFTFRAVFVGTLLGLIVTASNMYLGLTIGWSFGASLFGAIIGFSILKPLSIWLPPRFGGGYFGPKENCTLQTSATAAGGLSVGFISAIPALYRLGLMSPSVTQDTFALIMWSFAACYFGLFFAIPLRRYFILRQKLVFPSATVAAATIKSLHDNADGESSGAQQARVLIFTFAFALVFKCIVWFVPVLLEWHVLYYIGKAAGNLPLMAADVVWKWRLELSFAFVGAGMLVGNNTAASFFGGSVVAWAITGPLLLLLKVVGTAYGYPEVLTGSDGQISVDPNAKSTAQFWLLWPGVTLMVVSSFIEFGMRWRTISRGISGFFSEAIGSAQSALQFGRSGRFRAKKDDDMAIPMTGKDPAEDDDDETNGKTYRFGTAPTLAHDDDEGKEQADADEEDPAGPDEQVPVLWWSVGLVASIIFTTTILTTLFNVKVYEAFLAILLGFIFAFIGIQSSGETDIVPIGTIGKTSQFIFAAFRDPNQSQMLKTNLINGQIAAACAAQTVDMVGDLKTGHILRASPKSQFLAQLISAFFLFFSVGIFTLFGSSYPCILQKPSANVTCAFEAPAVASWTAVSLAVVNGVEKTVPSSSAWASLGAALFAVVFTVIKYTVVPHDYRKFMPNLNAAAIAIVNPQPSIGVAMLAGAILNTVWESKWPRTHVLLGYAVASGLIAGEGIGGIVEAVFSLSGLRQEVLSVSAGIPTKDEVAAVLSSLLSS